MNRDRNAAFLPYAEGTRSPVASDSGRAHDHGELDVVILHGSREITTFYSVLYYKLIEAEPARDLFDINFPW
jgi:hypothetical protein